MAFRFTSPDAGSTPAASTKFRLTSFGWHFARPSLRSDKFGHLTWGMLPPSPLSRKDFASRYAGVLLATIKYGQMTNYVGRQIFSIRRHRTHADTPGPGAAERELSARARAPDRIAPDRRPAGASRSRARRSRRSAYGGKDAALPDRSALFRAARARSLPAPPARARNRAEETGVLSSRPGGEST